LSDSDAKLCRNLRVIVLAVPPYWDERHALEPSLAADRLDSLQLFQRLPRLYTVDSRLHATPRARLRYVFTFDRERGRLVVPRPPRD
jgi:hypothetical protein